MSDSYLTDMTIRRRYTMDGPMAGTRSSQLCCRIVETGYPYIAMTLGIGTVSTPSTTVTSFIYPSP